MTLVKSLHNTIKLVIIHQGCHLFVGGHLQAWMRQFRLYFSLHIAKESENLKSQPSPLQFLFWFISLLFFILLQKNLKYEYILKCMLSNETNFLIASVSKSKLHCKSQKKWIPSDNFTTRSRDFSHRFANHFSFSLPLFLFRSISFLTPPWIYIVSLSFKSIEKQHPFCFFRFELNNKPPSCLIRPLTVLLKIVLLLKCLHYNILYCYWHPVEIPALLFPWNWRVRAINNQTVALFSDYTVWRGLEGRRWKGEKREE